MSHYGESNCTIEDKSHYSRWSDTRGSLKGSLYVGVYIGYYFLGLL